MRFQRETKFINKFDKPYIGPCGRYYKLRAIYAVVSPSKTSRPCVNYVARRQVAPVGLSITTTPISVRT